MTERINVLLITADQWRADCLSRLGHPTVRTPHLDELAAGGVTFRRHYAQCTPCGPSRASLLTGMYMMNHRSVRNGTPLDARFTNIALEMRKLGYDPGLIGYTDTSLDPRTLDPNDPALKTYSGTLPGFVQLVPGSEGSRAWALALEAKGYKLGLEAKSVYAPVADHPEAAGRGPSFAPARFKAEDSHTAFDVEAAIQHLKGAKRPWFLHLSLLRPHPPFIAPEPYNALYDPDKVPERIGAANPEAESKLHPHVAYAVKWCREKEGLDPATHPTEPSAMRQLRATYYGLMSEVDDQLGRLIAHLKEVRQFEKTLIVFTTDHGEQLWDHWGMGKEFFFEQSFNIPLIIRAPGRMADSARGRIVDAFTESIDVMPTILDWLSAELPLQCDGASLKPWLKGEAPAGWRDAAHFELDFRDVVRGSSEKELGIGLDDCALAVLRDKQYKYIHFAALPPILFDLTDDPHELRNRAEDPAYAGIKVDMMGRMLSWRLGHAERRLTGIRLTGDGPFEVPRARRQTTIGMTSPVP
ncbi:MAG: alkaline phosphatase family protein [Alphaproteobacteria bacterium]|nr:alkaline phosphatase family protein [Alphaproteobacteria bacterium]